MKRTALVAAVLILGGCATTDIAESPKTSYVARGTSEKTPAILWTSRGLLKQDFGYLGRVTARSWSYGGALSRLMDGAKELGGDALVDIHYQQVGFMNRMDAFVVKYEKSE